MEQRAELKAAVQGFPSQAGIDLSNWSCKSVRQFVADRFGLALSWSSCLNYPVSSTGQALHRLGFVPKRPKKRLLKADPGRREAFVGEYAALTAAAAQTGTKIFFADEAHFQADADLRGKWVLKGEPALVISTSPRRGEKVSYYSAVCLETGEVEVMELDSISIFPDQLNAAVRIFDDLQEQTMLPANEAWRDPVRQELDRRLFNDVLGLDDRVVEQLDILCRQWCSEPTVTSVKNTGPAA